MNKEPLTPEEVYEAANQFFPLFDIVHRNMPEGSKTEDTLKVMETVCALAHKLRAEKESTIPFGFNKKKDDTIKPDEC
jgi:predicted esterase